MTRSQQNLVLLVLFAATLSLFALYLVMPDPSTIPLPVKVRVDTQEQVDPAFVVSEPLQRAPYHFPEPLIANPLEPLVVTSSPPDVGLSSTVVPLYEGSINFRGPAATERQVSSVAYLSLPFPLPIQSLAPLNDLSMAKLVLPPPDIYEWVEIKHEIYNPKHLPMPENLRVRVKDENTLEVEIPKKLLDNLKGNRNQQDHIELWLMVENVRPARRYGNLSYQFGIGLGDIVWVDEFLKTVPPMKIKVQKNVKKDRVQILIRGFRINKEIYWNVVFSKSIKEKDGWRQGALVSTVPRSAFMEEEDLLPMEQ